MEWNFHVFLNSFLHCYQGKTLPNKYVFTLKMNYIMISKIGGRFQYVMWGKNRDSTTY